MWGSVVGRARCLLFLAVLSLAVPGQGHAALVEISAQGDGEPTAGALRFEPVTQNTDTEPAEPLEIELALPGRIETTLPDGISWKLQLQSDRYWSPEQILVPHGSVLQATVELFALGRASGKIELLDRGVEPPRELMARFRRISKPGSEVTEDTATCPIEDGRWTCRLPALELDLKLRAPGFVSHYFWAQTVPTAEPLDLGVLKLKRGTSIVGRVEMPDGLPPPSTCTVQLSAEQAGRSSAAAEPRTQGLAEKVKVNERGFFHFEGVAPGSRLVTAQLAGFVSASTAPILVIENREIELLEPLRLERPLEIEIAVQPLSDPAGEPWKLMLRRSEPPELVFSAQTDREGRLRKTGLAAGHYVLEVEDGRGSRLAAQEIELAPDHTFFAIDLPLLWVEGELRLGEEPLAGELHFGGRHSEVSVRMEAGDDGKFGGWLAHPGEWEVDVDSMAPPVFRRLRKVGVEKTPGLSVAHVKIELPDTRLEGEVVDEEGKVVPGAAVVAMPFPPVEKPAVARTDEEGAFLFRGFAPSAFRLEARLDLPGEKAVSDAMEVTVDETSSTPVRLVLKRLVELRGTLVSPSGTGVAGAMVSVLPLVTSGIHGLIAPVNRSDANGAFSVQIPSGTSQLDLTIFAPGFLLTRLRVAFEPSQPLTIPLQQEGGGMLELGLDAPVDVWNAEKPRPFVIHDGGVEYDLGTLETWASLNGARRETGLVRVPRMPPGNYSLCVRVRGEKGGAAPSKPPRCASGFLSPAGSLRLDIGAAASLE